MNGAQAAADGDIGDGARACVALGIETDNDVLVPAGAPVVVHDSVVLKLRQPRARGLAVAPPLAGDADEPPARCAPPCAPVSGHAVCRPMTPPHDADGVVFLLRCPPAAAQMQTTCPG